MEMDFLKLDIKIFLKINSMMKEIITIKEQEILKQEYVTDLLKKESEKNTEDVREAKDIDNLEHTNDRNKNKKDSEHKNKNAETEEANESETVAKTKQSAQLALSSLLEKGVNAEVVISSGETTINSLTLFSSKDFLKCLLKRFPPSR